MGTLKKRAKEVMDIIRQRPNFLSDKEAVEVLSKAVITGNKIIRNGNADDAPDKAPLSLMCDYVQMLLDFSYAIELKIVNDEFPSGFQDSIERVFRYLNEGLDLALSTSQDTGEGADTSRLKELRECIYWRKGALLYMYCHTAYNNQPQLLPDDQQKSQFVKFAYDGVLYLAIEMRKCRLAETEQEYISTDAQVQQLVKQGIFSDVNMLALMYAAEMCLWIDKFAHMMTAEQKKVLDHRSLGLALSQQYLDLSHGALKDAKWCTDQAQIINNHFRS